MEGLAMPLLWAQTAGSGSGAAAGSSTGVGNPAAMAAMAFRRWCSGLTLSSPDAVPGLDGLWAFLAGLAALLLVAMVFQGPLLALKQLIDIPGHAALVQRATRRVWRAGRLVSVLITFTVLAWTGSQALNFLADRTDRGKTELTLLSRSRARFELAFEQGCFASLTPLRDVVGLADNLPLLICAVYLVFRVSSGMSPPIRPAAGQSRQGPVTARYTAREKPGSGWPTVIWGCGSLYILYRLVARASGSSDLPLGGCLVVEALVVPLLMLVCDGFLLAWVLTELRNSGFDQVGEDRLHPAQAFELMPAAALVCALALPARYVATLVFLALQHLPTSVGGTSVGRYIRWQLGWGLVDLQAASLVLLGIVGVVAWSRGSFKEALWGFKRLLEDQAGHLIMALAMAGGAACLLAGLIYPLVLLLPPAGWVLPAADSYAHYLTLPIGLWTLAALIELAERTLPVAGPASSLAANQVSSNDGIDGISETPASEATTESPAGTSP